MATYATTVNDYERRAHSFHRWVLFTSIALTLAMLPLGILSLGVDQLADYAIVAAVFVGLEVVWTVSVGVIGVGYGYRFMQGLRLALQRKELEELFVSIPPNRIVWAGFYSNAFIGLLQPVVLAAAIVALLPPANWVWLLLPFAELVLTLLRCGSWLYLLNSGAGKVRVWPAEIGDIDAYTQIQRESWGDDMAAQAAQLVHRFKVCREGILVGRRFGAAVGMVTTINIANYSEGDPPSWNEITDNGWCTTHDPAGTIMFGVDMSVAQSAPDGVPNDLLLSCMAKIIRDDLECGILGGRMPGYHLYSDTMSADEYLRATRESDGRPLDRQVRMYTSIPGVQALAAIEDYFEDPESLNWGVLLKWSNPCCSYKNRRWYKLPLYNSFARRLLAWMLPRAADLELRLSRLRHR